MAKKSKQNFIWKSTLVMSRLVFKAYDDAWKSVESTSRR